MKAANTHWLSDLLTKKTKGFSKLQLVPEKEQSRILAEIEWLGVRYSYKDDKYLFIYNFSAGLKRICWQKSSIRL